MSRKRQRQSAFTLFAFQDIITAVTGIMLLITLLLTLELVGRKEKASQEATTKTAASENVAVSAEELVQLEVDVSVLKKEHQDMMSVNAMLAKHDSKQVLTELEKMERMNKDRQAAIRRRQKELHMATTQQKDAQKPQDSAKPLDEIIQQTKAKLKKIQKSSRIFVQAAKGSKKTNWLMEISKTGLKVAPLGKSVAPASFSNDNDFRQWLSKRSQASDHFILLVKAGGTLLYRQVAVSLDQKGFSKGKDVLQQGDHVIDDTTGAGIP